MGPLRTIALLLGMEKGLIALILEIHVFVHVF